MQHRSTSADRPTGARRVALAGLTSVAVLAAGVVPVALAPAALADPAVSAPTAVFGVGAISGVVPDGVCAVEVVVVGGAGGRAAAGANGTGSNGGAARVTATFDVVPGTAFGGSVGGGGRENSGNQGGAGGANGGGAGGAVSGQHGGAGGGGASELTLGGDLAVLAGGGGGSGGGHSVSVDGFGGDAGLPVAAGVVAPGSAGTDGYEGVTAGGDRIVVGGGAGGAATPGAGGVHSVDATLNGLPGAGRTGGAGAYDPNYDAGGGGGGGYQGGGGGASTLIQNTDPDGSGTVISTVAGGGGGGGSSLVAAGATGVGATAVGRQTGTGAGAPGSITLDWVECGYDLAVTKTVSVDGGPQLGSATAVTGDVLTWTVTVTNRGPAAMTRGDVVTLRDSVPGTGPAVLTSVTTTGGTDGPLERGPVTCDAVAGDPLPAELTCSRPFAPLGGSASDDRGLDVGETVTVVATQTVTDPAGTTLTNVAAVEDRGDPADNAATAVVTVVAPPAASDDSDTRNAIGSTVVVDVLGNDSGTSAPLDPASVVLRDPAGGWVTSLTVPGEGTWTVDAATGSVTFAPTTTFRGDPTPVGYRVADANGLTATAEVVVTYLPQATDDVARDNAPGTAVTVDVVGNDAGRLDPRSVRLVDPADGSVVTRLVVTGEGTWTVDPGTGAITFTPQDGFRGDPTPVGYRVSDLEGDVTSAQVVVTYLPAATPPAAAPPAATTPAAAPGAPLAATGAEAGAAAGAAVLLLLVGTALVAWRRRAGRA
ncbi:hypothetical protein [Cellulomonas sp. NPDC058312]|uniref:hypothetical protein n=1 Tax=Cellulomonas sp. NPDC058312 TaxID=3346441 RepID=UPI0036E7BDFD